MGNINSRIDPNSIGIVATTSYPRWYRGKPRSVKDTDKIRGDLTVEFVKIARKIGYQVVIADWQSPQTLLK